jgi:penicillin-binding protein 1A
MEECVKDKPVQTFPIPEGIIFARINPHSGYIIGSGNNEPGGVYAAFAGSIPSEARTFSRSDASESTEGADAAGTSPAESFFKSDLF